VAGERELVITAGFHGEEPAGPLTLQKHLGEVVRHARSRKVGLRIFPCVNPSGFERGQRYNASGERPNNDLLRYEMENGELKGELQRGQSFVRWHPYRDGPKETRALVTELEKGRTPEAALDIHQDPYLGSPLAYSYAFGPKEAFRPLIAATGKHLPVAKSASVDVRITTDEDGLIALHDGSVTDYFFRRGVPYTAAVETTTRSPMEACHQVNLIWILGFVDLAALAQ
jgi:hypothetical protein